MADLDEGGSSGSDFGSYDSNKINDILNQNDKDLEDIGALEGLGDSGDSDVDMNMLANGPGHEDLFDLIGINDD